MYVSSALAQYFICSVHSFTEWNKKEGKWFLESYYFYIIKIIFNIFQKSSNCSSVLFKLFLEEWQQFSSWHLYQP